MDADDIAKQIRIQKYMGTLPTEFPLCHRCGTPVQRYPIHDEATSDEGRVTKHQRRGEDEFIYDNYCQRCRP